MITDADLDPTELWDSALAALEANPSQETHDACVAISVAQRLTNYIGAEPHAEDLRNIAEHWPPKQGDTCPQED